MNICVSRASGMPPVYSINESPHATAVLDSQGRICGCGVAMEDIFGAGQSQLIGKRISKFIVGILFEENSPDDNARQLLRLCAEHHWQEFEAIDARGQIFGVEIQLARQMFDEQQVFVLKLRQPLANKIQLSCP